MAVQRRDRIGARQLLSASTVMQNSSCHRRVHAPEPHERVPRHAERVAQRTEMLLDQVRVEAIVPAGTGVCVVNTTCAATRRIASTRIDPFELHAAADQLERRKRTVPSFK
jgi:hypothetical protein